MIGFEIKRHLHSFLDLNFIAQVPHHLRNNFLKVGFGGSFSHLWNILKIHPTSPHCGAKLQNPGQNRSEFYRRNLWKQNKLERDFFVIFKLIASHCQPFKLIRFFFPIRRMDPEEHVSARLISPLEHYPCYCHFNEVLFSSLWLDSFAKYFCAAVLISVDAFVVRLF